MQSAILVLHLMVALALIGAVLLQRSEGGALGIGGGGGGGGGGFGGLMSGRGASGGLVKVSVVLGAMFFATSIGLSVLSNSGGGSVLDTISVEDTGGGASGAGIRLGSEAAGDTDDASVPAAEAPAEPEGPAVPLSQ